MHHRLGSTYALLGIFVLAALPVRAGAHTWDISEVFSTADGCVWFAEMYEANGSPVEYGVWNRPFSSDTETFSICILSEGGDCNLTPPTTHKRLLFGNPAYDELALLQGAPRADQVVDIAPFFAVAGDTLTYSPYDAWTFGPVPVNGVDSLHRVEGVARNSPTNYLGFTGTIDAGSPPPAGVPDGSNGSMPLLVEKLDSGGSALRLSWDTESCAIHCGHQIVFGQASDLPAAPGGAFTPEGGVCGIGGRSPFVWSSTPPTDGAGLLWWIVVATNGAGAEGSWGRDGAGVERVGPGPGGSSGLCGMTSRSLVNGCGR